MSLRWAPPPGVQHGSWRVSPIARAQPDLEELHRSVIRGPLRHKTQRASVDPKLAEAPRCRSWGAALLSLAGGWSTRLARSPCGKLRARVRRASSDTEDGSDKESGEAESKDDSASDSKDAKNSEDKKEEPKEKAGNDAKDGEEEVKKDSKKPSEDEVEKGTEPSEPAKEEEPKKEAKDDKDKEKSGDEAKSEEKKEPAKEEEPKKEAKDDKDKKSGDESKSEEKKKPAKEEEPKKEAKDDKDKEKSGDEAKGGEEKKEPAKEPVDQMDKALKSEQSQPEEKPKKDSDKKKPEVSAVPKAETTDGKGDVKQDKPSKDTKGKAEQVSEKSDSTDAPKQETYAPPQVSGMVGEMLAALKPEEKSEGGDKEAKQQAVDMMEEVLDAFKPNEKRKDDDVTKEMKQQAKEYFDWNRAWYPIAPLDYLHTDKPNPVKLLGKRMVVWCSDTTENIWHAALDSCPHRMAPLSAGEVLESGELRCRYHGWCFNAAGNCVSVPMARNEAEETRICGLGRSCLATFPVQVKQGLVWIFPSAGQDALTQSKKSAPCVTPEMEGAEWIMTVAPVGYQVSMENTFDPSHAPFLHNGIVKYSAERARAMTKFDLRDGVISGKRGFVLQHGGYDESTEGISATRQFVPPCSNTTVYKYADGRVETNQLYFVPCGPHETRYIVNFGSGPPKRKLPTSVEDVMHVLFFNKIFGYRFQEQDLVAMVGQERAQHENSNYAWGDQYVLGTPSDKGVEVFRKWFYEFANGGHYFSRASRTLPASDAMIFDRWQRHAKHCPRCRRVMRSFGKVQSWAGRVSVCGLIASAIFFLRHHRNATEATLLVTLVSAALGRWAAAERWSFVSSVPLKGNMEVAVYKDKVKDYKVKST